MTQYAVLWNDKSRTFTIKDEDVDKPAKNALTRVYYGREGEIPDPASHPEIQQHLTNRAQTMGIDYRFVTVKNQSSNERLDQFEKVGDDFEEVPEADTVVTTSKEEAKAAAKAAAD